MTCETCYPPPPLHPCPRCGRPYPQRWHLQAHLLSYATAGQQCRRIDYKEVIEVK